MVFGDPFLSSWVEQIEGEFFLFLESFPGRAGYVQYDFSLRRLVLRRKTVSGKVPYRAAPIWKRKETIGAPVDEVV